MPKPISVLFGHKPGWATFIDKDLDRSRFDPTFATGPLPSYPLDNFDLICPFRLDEATALRKAKARGEVGQNHLVPSAETMTLAANKARFNEFLQDTGFGVHVPPFGPDARPPYIVKPERGEFGQNCSIAQTQDELDQICADMIARNIPHFVQSAIGGALEYTTHLISKNGQIQYDLTIVNDMGTGLSVRGVKHTPLTRDICKRSPHPVFAQILQHLNYTGTCCFNYKVVDQTPKIFELNPRFGATLTLSINDYLDAYVAALSG